MHVKIAKVSTNKVRTKGNKVPKELHSWLPIPKYLEILVTALCMSVEIANFQVTPINKSFSVKELVRKAKSNNMIV